MMGQRKLRALIGVAVLSLGAAWISSPIPASAGGAPDSLITSNESRVGQPLAKSGKPALRNLPSPSCSETVKGAQVCIEPMGSKSGPVGQAKNIDPWPNICATSIEEGGVIYADSRGRACRGIDGNRLYTTRTVNGVTTLTGEVFLTFLDHTYASPNSGQWTHQTGIYSTSGWGDATRATVGAVGTAGGSCSLLSEDFASQPVWPTQVVRNGESRMQTFATAVGSVGNCTTIWSFAFVTPGYPATTTTTGMQEIRCDNNSGASRGRPVRVGCVVPWYPAAVTYSRSSYPSLASHVSRAQGSGLPGRFVNAPLIRSTVGADETTNRQRACGDAPSIAGKNCDEYPLATTRNGLAFGGSRRTFPDCSINAPVNVTGPSGASACMITATENSAQGGLMSGFYYDERVLHLDPYLVYVGP